MKRGGEKRDSEDLTRTGIGEHFFELFAPFFPSTHLFPADI